MNSLREGHGLWTPLKPAVSLRASTLLQQTDILPAQIEAATGNQNRCKSYLVTFRSLSPWLKERAIVENLLEMGTLQSKDTSRKYLLSFFTLWAVK